VTDALLLPGAKRAVVGLMRIRKNREEQLNEPVEVLVLDLETGKDKKIAQAYLWRSRVSVIDNQVLLPEGDRIRLISIDTGQVAREFRLSSPMVVSAVSSNRRWLAAVDDAGTATLLDLTSFNLKTTSIASPGKAGPMAVTNDGRYIYVLTRDGQLASWDLNTSQFTETTLTRIREMHTNADFMTLANDDKWVVTAGNHADVGIFDRATSRLVSYTQVSAAVVYAEKVWVRGDRLIFTTDTGVLFDGRLK
jgi:WD40 repeat protein